MKPFSYSDAQPPAAYACGRCGASGCKLWRPYQTFARILSLRCAACGEREQGDELALERTDQIGSLVPAVPTEDGATYWGYTSVPAAGVAWWRALPTRSEAGPH